RAGRVVALRFDARRHAERQAALATHPGDRVARRVLYHLHDFRAGCRHGPREVAAYLGHAVAFGDAAAVTPLLVPAGRLVQTDAGARAHQHALDATHE